MLKQESCQERRRISGKGCLLHLVDGLLVWIERNRRYFEDSANNTWKWKSNCMAWFYCWCRMKHVVEAESILELLESLQANSGLYFCLMHYFLFCNYHCTFLVLIYYKISSSYLLKKEKRFRYLKLQKSKICNFFWLKIFLSCYQRKKYY